MGREYEEGLIRTHQQKAPKKKGEAAPNLLNDLVKMPNHSWRSSRSGEPNFEVGAATFWERYRIFDQEIKSFSRV